MKQCNYCGKNIRPTGKFHRCSGCGAEQCRANETASWYYTKMGERGAKNEKN